jgi:hypothetical protein
VLLRRLPAGLRQLSIVLRSLFSLLITLGTSYVHCRRVYDDSAWSYDDSEGDSFHRTAATRQMTVVISRRIRLAQLKGTQSARRIFPKSSNPPEATRRTLRGSSAFEMDHAAHAPEADANATTHFMGAKKP